jgi:hypothetical protein
MYATRPGRKVANLVQLRLTADAATYKKKHVSNHDRRYLLSGLLRCANCGASFVIGAHQGHPRVAHYRCSFRASRGKVVCTNRVTVPQPALEARVRQTLDVVIKDDKQLKALVHEHNQRVTNANQGQLAVVRALEARRQVLEQQRGHLIEAIKFGTGAAKLLVGELDKCVHEMTDLAKKITEAEALVQPLLLPRAATVANYKTGTASIFTGDYATDRHFLEKVIEAIVVYADGSLLLQFKESSLFQPVKFARLQNKPPQGEDLAAQRRAQQAELDRMLADAAKTLTPDQMAALKANMEVDLHQDADGQPAFVIMTKGAVKRSFPPAPPETIRKIALASPAGQPRYFQPTRTVGRSPCSCAMSTT